MSEDYIAQYYHLQHESFCDHIKAVVDDLEKILDMKGNQVTEQQRTVVRELKALYTGQVIEDIKHDLASGHVTRDTVEKRVQLDAEACKAVIELMNPSPIGKVFIELIHAEQVNAMRTNLKSQVMWMNNEKS